MNTQWQALQASAAFPYQLPINEVIDDICEALNQHDTVVLKAPPGAGKTTVVPLALMMQPWAKSQKILVLEPRRLAAKSAAKRLADILSEPVGKRVGYRMRNESKVSSSTVIEVITEGLLTRLLQDDPALDGIAAIVFDEFHERNLNSDLGLALASQSAELFRENLPLKLIVMSATLEGVDFSRALPSAPIIESVGRQYPVELVYGKTQSLNDYLAPPMAQLIQRAVKETSGSILVFLPGQKEINQLKSLLAESEWLQAQAIQVLPLYGSLDLEQQWQAIQPLPKNSEFKRKLVLATDIAETSLTIEGVSTVVDSGLCRVAVFDPKTAMTSLQTKRISQASSIQRAGRAGRLEAGYCYRLWGESTQASLAKQATPEILQTDLLDLCLQLSCWGISDLGELNWLDAPPAGQFSQAQDLLQVLGALSENDVGDFVMTAHGMLMNQLPVHPRLAHMLLVAAQLNQLDTQAGWINRACAISCLIDERDPLHYYNANLDARVDVLLGDVRVEKKFHTWLRRNQFQMTQLQKKLGQHKSLLKNVSQGFFDKEQLQAIVDLNASEKTAFLLTLAYPDRVAKAMGKSGRYKLSNGQSVRIHSDDELSVQPFLVVANLGGVTGGLKNSKDILIFSAAVMQEDSFTSIYQQQIINKTALYWDDRKNRFIAETQQCFQQLCLQTSPADVISESEKIAALVQVIRSKGLSLLDWTADAQQLRARVQLMFSLQQSNALKNNALIWSSFDDDYLLSTCDDWLSHHLSCIKTLQDFKKINVHKALQALLPWPCMQTLDELLPEKYCVPSGSSIRLDYSQSPPILAVKLQEMFGEPSTPSVANGALPLLLHLLSPAGKPLQVTQDLAAFWQGSYAEVVKEMKGKYPRHPWPDNPLTFEATRLTKWRLAKNKL